MANLVIRRKRKKNRVPDFTHIEVGDTVKRMLAGKIPMDLKVTEITEDLIVTGGGWTFDRRTGAEVDEDLQWGPKYGVTGSYLVEGNQDG